MSIKPAEFAKIFDTEVGQILVKRDEDGDDNPSVSFEFDPGVDGIGLCTLHLGFQDSEKGVSARDAAFENVDQKMALELVQKQIARIEDHMKDD